MGIIPFKVKKPFHKCNICKQVIAGELEIKRYRGYCHLCCYEEILKNTLEGYEKDTILYKNLLTKYQEEHKSYIKNEKENLELQRILDKI